VTPRTITLVQAADLDAWQRVLVALCRMGDAADASARLLIVPSRHAGEQFRRTLEHRTLVDDEGMPQALAAALGVPAVAPGRARAVIAPRMVTRDDWYEHWSALAGLERPLATPMAREVLMAAAARHLVDAGARAPFLIRPGLVAEMVQLHAAIHRLGHDLDAAVALVTPELEADAPSDRGAARLLEQTGFLWAAFADYDARLAASGLADERDVRAACLAAPEAFSGLHVVVAVPDHHAAAHGLWPADVRLLASLPLARLDVIYTRRQGATGLDRRWRQHFPRAKRIEIDAQRPPVTRLETGRGGRWFECRDREEEVLLFARRVKAAPAAQVPATALVYRRPLPYLYLAQHVLGAAGIPFETRETLPLAAEPWAAALDVLMDSVLADHTRAALVAVLRHPQLRFTDAAGTPLEPAATLAFDRLLARDRYLGGAAQLAELARQWRDGRTAGRRRDLPAAIAVADVALHLLERLAPLHGRASAAEHLRTLADVLDAVMRPADDLGAGDLSRVRRVRAATRMVIEGLRDVYDAHDRRPVQAREVFAVLRRWMEGRTFAPARDGHGVQVLDLDAAAFGHFERVRVVGLIDGEWPEPSARNVFYPAFLLARLGWADERARAAATRAAFADLLELPTDAVGVSVPALEQDAVVRPSALLDELAAFGPSRQLPVPDDEVLLPVTPDAAMLATPLPVAALDPASDARAWLDWRMARGALPPSGYTARLEPMTHSVTAVERYHQCPFQYFAATVLALEEEPEDEAGLPSRDAGVFVHDVLRACYDAWQARGRVAIRAEDLPEARAVFAEVAERALARLAPADRALERLRLFGSAVATGLLEKVLRVEVEAFGDVVDRRLEVEIDGHVTVPRDDDGARRVALRGRVDRVDVTTGGGIRVIDYKSGRKPQQASLQPAVYALALLEQQGRTIADVAPSGYVALREVAPWSAVIRDAAAAREAAREFGDFVDAIERGEFPVRPLNVFRCRFCDFGSVCRKDYVGDDQA
jgi:RecB family exonuclease